MCNETREINVKVPADLSHTGKPVWKNVPIDACIADIVEAMQSAGIDMRASCCGHGKKTGIICLQDGRALVIHSAPPPEDGLSPESSNLLRDTLFQSRTEQAIQRHEQTNNFADQIIEEDVGLLKDDS